MSQAQQPAPGPAVRIGLLGGSFDPVHNAHLALARSAIDTLALDELIWIPTGVAWQKTRALSPAADRLAMLRLAIADAPCQRIALCEIERGGPSYMIDTVIELQTHPSHALEETQDRPKVPCSPSGGRTPRGGGLGGTLKETHGRPKVPCSPSGGRTPRGGGLGGTQWWLLLGQDQLANLPTWHRWRELVSRVRIAVANRAGVAPRVPGELAAAGIAVAEVPLAPMSVSSTGIRSRVAQGQGVASLVPAPVARYIELHGLYRDPLRS